MKVSRQTLVLATEGSERNRWRKKVKRQMLGNLTTMNIKKLFY
jgi:hypothetical protein